MHARLKNVHNNIEAWLKTYSDLNPYVEQVNPVKYKNPADIVILKIQNYLKGMHSLIEKLGFSSEFKLQANIAKTLVKGSEIYTAAICETYPT